MARLFQAFGRPGSLDVGGVSIANYVWKPAVSVEMKQRGEDLQHHYRQVSDSWARPARKRS